MAEEKEVKLRCGVYGEGTVFPVKIARDAEVSALQKKIFYEMRYNYQGKFDSSMLTLYLARKKGETTWMKHDNNTESFLQGDIDTDYVKMLSSWGLDDDKYLGPDFTTGDGDIHVLVELPEAAVRAGVLAWPRKRKFSEEKLVKLEGLWDYSKMNITVLPNATELKAMLQQPLPFRLALDNDKTAEKICDKNGDLLQCKDLTLMIEYYLLECKWPVESMAFESTWQAFYDDLFRIPSRICFAKGIYLNFCRNFVDGTGRPDLILHYYGLVLLRGEERSSSTVIDVSCKELTKKMRKWNPMFYGDLPYILGYATSGPRLKIVTIDRHLHAEKVVEFYHIIAQKDQR
ncbi:hypothetical protein PR003_g2878 [Phytophthora rubi]|uniref:Crinkler effector protein N-terminal domain-containing protein n=1 Tax=Phytophthora rubi TaxID=129364 RepID=A0A6A4FRM1_9STRA|nr:hypothetical protein PR003_g2878 [Phytophthora rubi]